MELNHLYCTLCEHDMNSSSYKIFKHPRIHAPLCILCFERVQDELSISRRADISEFCTWCFDGGYLFVCDRCDFAFCRDCIDRHLGTKVSSKIEIADPWHCFICDPKPLIEFINDMDEFARIQECSDEEDLEIIASRLSAIEIELTNAEENLKEGNVNNKRKEITDEIGK